MAAMGHPDWGGGPGDHTGPGGAGVAVADLVAPTGEPDVRARFEVRQDDEGYTVNGRSPGPLLSAVVGDLTARSADWARVAGGAAHPAATVAHVGEFGRRALAGAVCAATGVLRCDASTTVARTWRAIGPPTDGST